MKAVTVPLYEYKGKGSKSECKNFRGLNLTIIGKGIDRTVSDNVKRFSKPLVSEEHRSKKGRGCVDQIFAFRLVVKKSIEKKENVCSIYRLQKAYD